MNKLNALNNEAQAMTSLDVWELTGRLHISTLKFIRHLVNNKLISSDQFDRCEHTFAAGRRTTMDKLDKAASILFIAKQSPECIEEMIDKWHERSLSNQLHAR